MPRPQSGQVQTVLGPIAAADMGVTLPHEHLLIDFKVMFVEPAAAGDKGRAWEPVTPPTTRTSRPSTCPMTAAGWPTSWR